MHSIARLYKMYRQNRKLRTKFKSYVKTTIICAVIMQFIVIASWYAASSVIRPPEVPVAPATSFYTPVRESIPTLVLQPAEEDEEEDEYGFYIAPMVAGLDERKPMFFTFLVFGLTEGLNANTIMVASYDAETGVGHIISIPRDTKIDAQRNNRKIVAAYNVGRLNGGGHEGGVERLKSEVQTLLGFRPDFYVSIDYEAFVRMVDAVNGVEVYVPFHMRYDDPCQDLHIDIPAGLQTLDGEDALRFARYRRGNNRRYTITDYQRIEHQQQVIDSIFRSLLTPRTIFRIPEFISIFSSHLDSDLAYGELLWFANQARGFITGGASPDSLEFHTLPMLGTSGAPHWYELADGGGILELVNRTVNPFVRDITASELRIAGAPS